MGEVSSDRTSWMQARLLIEGNVRTLSTAGCGGATILILKSLVFGTVWVVQGHVIVNFDTGTLSSTKAR